ncbi:hypothetical protein JOB18_004534 [Solea senegalensis]|uniref:Heat shock factor 5 n=1 Tax=Solea senegalensis TaxID=28829 RepID=A0AAV6SF52_SOLSE|nr:heat shock factor 5 [Solea senegalensis]KAG7515282.1 hypothetical protein JOB18_004534 [Solea senegalensis]
MDASGGSLPDYINPTTFPAKLWRLVNNPTKTSICWDLLGESIVVHQELFELQVLSGPSSCTSSNSDNFKTNKFCSFVRQLNLYGFKKTTQLVKVNSSPIGGTFHRYFHKNFKRNHPELVGALRRLTADNRTKLSAGQEVSSRSWARPSGGGGSDGDVKKEIIVLSPTNQMLTHPHKAQAWTAPHVPTPAPPLYPMGGHADGAAPPALPISSTHPSTGVASCSNTVYIQQALPPCTNHGGATFISYNPCSTQFQPGFYSPFFQYYHPNLVASHVAGNGLQVTPFSPQVYYQIADELTPIQSSNCPVKVELPEQQARSVIERSNQGSNMKANTSYAVLEVITDGENNTEGMKAEDEDPHRDPSTNTPTIKISTC